MKMFKLIIMAISMMSFTSFVSAKEKLSKTTQTQMIKALELNEELHMSYFKYDAAKIEKSRDQVLAALSKVNDKKLQDKLAKAIKYLKEIKKSNRLEDNNKYYHFANVFLIQLINKFDFGPKYQAYYCPMVRKKWIQNVSKMEKVHNPYDSSMPHCGGRL